jgi:hypothetical protein
VGSRFSFIWTMTVLIACLCPIMSGCLSYGWAYPTASFVPAISIAPVPQDVRAFRIDIKDDHSFHWVERNDLFDEGEDDLYEMSEMTIRFGDRLCPQGKLAVDYGWESSGSASSSSPFVRGRESNHLLLVRLYRPGYKTVEIQSWQLASNPVWHEAKTLIARERAIDDLVSTFERDARAHAKAFISRGANESAQGPAPPRDSTVFDRMAPGSTSAAHRAALIFAASEYELLEHAALDGVDRDVIARVTRKALDLRKLAAD